MQTLKKLMPPLLVGILVINLVLSAPMAVAAKNGKPAERVTGIGGFFFKSHDPKGLAEWYETYLGIDKVPESYEGLPWQQESGSTVFAPFPKDTTHFGPKDWMINFRVRSLDVMVKQLRAAGIKVEVDPDSYPNGRFAHLSDPEGNPIELWEPSVNSKSSKE